MKAIRKVGAQGDVLFRRVDAIPSEYQPATQPGPSGAPPRSAGAVQHLIVAHSESGHHHVIASPDVTLYTGADPFVCFLRLEGADADVEHLRPYDTHETLRLLGQDGGPTCYEVRRQREYAPERDPRMGAFRRVED